MINNNKDRNSVTDKSFLILQFNANKMKNHIHELETVLINIRIDIALIMETHFTEYSDIYISRHKLIKTNYPDNTAHGGVVILVKSSITFQPLPSFRKDYIQSCAIILKLNNLTFTIAAIYNLPKHNITNLQFSEYFNTITNNFIIGGDYNAKHQSWRCQVNNPRGVVLHTFVSTKPFKVLAPPGPTYWPSSTRKNPDVLDIFFTKFPRHIFCITENILDLNSDYSSVLLTLNATSF